MTEDNVIQVIYNWVNTILNTENSLGWTIILANQNAARPVVPYFVIQDPFISNSQQGRGNWQKWEFEDEVEDIGQVNYTIQNEATIQLETVGTNGKEFKLLTNSLNRQDIKDYFRDNNVTVLRTENTVPAVNITEDYIEKRATKDIVVLWTDSGNYDPSYIGTVDTSGSYNIE